MIGIGIGGALGTGASIMNYRSLALAIVSLSSAHITSAAAQSVYVAPGGVYVGGGPVYVIPAPSNGNGTYVEPTADGYGMPEPTPYPAPTVVAPGAGYVAAAPYGLNGNGNGYGIRPSPYYGAAPVVIAPDRSAPAYDYADVPPPYAGAAIVNYRTGRWCTIKPSGYRWCWTP
jgi:hypothetical protein